MGATNVFKVLVIDDEESRNKTYNDVLSDHFFVKTINDIGEITKRVISEYDLLVIDVCLSKKVESLTAFRLLDEYKVTLPIVLISGEWIKENGEPNEFILKVPMYKNIIKVISWNDFNKEENNKKISEEIFYEFCKYRNIATSNDSDKCVILHLSDLQFGGETSSSALNDNQRIAAYLSENKIYPDLIVITGDIADKGKEKEYKIAKEWIEQLAQMVLCNGNELKYDDRQKIIFVPGNHDYDISICASDFYSFKFGSETKDTFIKKQNEIDFSNQKLGFANFINFAYELTKNEGWFYYFNKAIHINDRFLNYGIRLLYLNSVYKINSRNCENRFDEFYCDLSTYSEHDFYNEEKQIDDVVNIMITHNPPEDFHKLNTKGEKSWGIYQTLVQDNKINVCLYGHTHDMGCVKQLRDSGGNYCKKMICIPAPSLRLNSAARTEDATRGFNIIEINKTSSIDIRSFKMIKASIEEGELEHFNI